MFVILVEHNVGAIYCATKKVGGVRIFYTYEFMTNIYFKI